MGKLENNYEEYLISSKIPKIPFIRVVPELSDLIPVAWGTTSDIIGNNPQPKYPPENPIWAQLRDISIKPHRKTSDILIQMYQRGQTISRVGRMRGNMEYIEDKWNIQIQPPAFKYAYLNGGTIDYTAAKQMKIRDKYLKIRVRYDGTQYVVVNAIKTKYTISHA